MKSERDILDGITNHLADASKLISDSFQLVSREKQIRYAEASLQLASLRQQLANPIEPAADAAPVVAESEDERIEREAAAAVLRVAAMMTALELSLEEQAFSRHLGEMVVDMVTDSYVQYTRQHHQLDGACITAAIAVAMVIVHDAPDA